MKSCKANYYDSDSLCGGIVRGWERLFDDVQSCCATMLGHQDLDLCVQDSLHRGDDHYTNKYYANQRNQQCVKDCDISTPGCGGSPYDITVSLYGSGSECCTQELSWLGVANCTLQSSVPDSPDPQQWFREDSEPAKTMEDIWKGANIPNFREEEDLPTWPTTANPAVSSCMSLTNSPL